MSARVSWRAWGWTMANESGADARANESANGPWLAHLASDGTNVGKSFARDAACDDLFEMSGVHHEDALCAEVLASRWGTPAR